MTNWHTVRDSRADKPETVDKVSSPTTIYQRRNIEQITVPDEMTGESHSEWQYEQRELTVKEYLALMDEEAAQRKADIDYIAMETGVDLDD